MNTRYATLSGSKPPEGYQQLYQMKISRYKREDKSIHTEPKTSKYPFIQHKTKFCDPKFTANKRKHSSEKKCSDIISL